MKLLVSAIPYDSGKSGISVYVREVVRELYAAGHELTLLCEPDTEGESFGLPDCAGVERIYAPKWTRRPALSMAWHLFMLPSKLKRLASRFDGMVICAANRRVLSSYPIPTAATVHDLANFHIKGKYSRLRMIYLAKILPHFAKKAQRLVAVSSSTKKDMVDFWSCRNEDVSVLYNGLPAGIKRRECAKGSSILYISRIEHPGKNHVRLIEAYGALDRSLAEAHPLVIAGADWKDAEAVHEAAKSSPHHDLITFTGFVDDATLERLWDEAGFYVFPSLFEGFGLSLAEAMARGIPSAASENGSLGEIAADAAVKFDPWSVESIKAALEKLLTEPKAERDDRISRGIKRAAEFSWRDHASGLVRLIDDAHREMVEGTVDLFGIPVAKVQEADAVEKVISLAKGGKKGGKAAFVATLNVDFVSNAVMCRPFGGNEELWGYLKGADFVTADGMPIVLLSRIMGNPLPCRVTGADLVPMLAKRCASEGLSIYVLGGTEESLKEAFAKLDAKAPGLKIAGTDSSFVKLDEDQPEIVERINKARPDILFVALGNPKQELWMGRNASKLDVPVMIGVGGTFNFIAGRVKRAPVWMQKCGLEWIYRVSQEPGRLWRRYAYGLVKFSYLSLVLRLGGFRK